MSTAARPLEFLTAKDHSQSSSAIGNGRPLEMDLQRLHGRRNPFWVVSRHQS
jgi:hypothetical protein